MGRPRTLVYNVGINDAGYPVTKAEISGYNENGKPIWKTSWVCPIYSVWKALLQRTCDSKYKKQYPAYKDAEICESWKLFSNFSDWYKVRYKDGYQIDKDILIKDNKIYSPDTCIIVPVWLNMFVLEKEAYRGNYKLGVCFDKRAGKILAQVSNGGRSIFLGYFKNENDAHIAWCKKKLSMVEEFRHDLDNIDTRIYHALVLRYNTYIDITGESK